MIQRLLADCEAHYGLRIARKLRLLACATIRQVYPELTTTSQTFLGVAEDFANGRVSSRTLHDTCLQAEIDRDAHIGVDENCPHLLQRMAVVEVCLTYPRYPVMFAHFLPYANDTETARRLLKDVLPYPEYKVVDNPLCHYGKWRHPHHFCDCPVWLNSTIMDLAEAAYANREQVRCEACCGRGGRDWYPRDDPTNSRLEGPVWSVCPSCSGSGSRLTGLLSPDQILVLADALEEAGADADVVSHFREGSHIRGCRYLDFILGKT